MNAQVHEITIRGLHSRLDVTIPIKDNRLILVGVNGLGKTTVVNALFYFLSRQWRRLSHIAFDEMSLTIGTEEFIVRRETLLAPSRLVRRVVRQLPASVRENLMENPALLEHLRDGNFDQIEEHFRMPSGYLRRRLAPISVQPELFDDALIESSPLAEVDGQLAKLFPSQVLYMPTYRRIEQDLRELFPNFDEETRRRLSRSIARHRHNDRSYVELVQFGMEDVQAMVTSRIDRLKEQVRVELNELAGSYLRDVIRGDAEKYERTDIEELDDDEVDRILARVEEGTLRAQDKNRLRKAIRAIRTGGGSEESSQERYLAHFFTKVVDMHRSQQQRESQLRHFVSVCNEYLEGKCIEYNDSEYSMRILGDGDFEIEMGQLSSGEKQVLSLFSHVYLSDAGSFYVVIDEPELSLSVDWQKRLLPDLVNSGRCDFLAAVTHSPFIYDNSLEDYATDLRSCTALR